jgi:oligopeptidase A
VWENIQPAVAEAGLQALLEDTEAAFDELEARHTPTWDGLMLPLEALQDRLGRVFGAVVHLTSVKYSDALQAAYDAVRPRYVVLSNRIRQSVPLYQGMVALRDQDAEAMADPARRRILDESIRTMERSGVHLEGAARQRYQEIQERLAELSNRFQTNLVKEEKTARVHVHEAQRLSGIPAPILDMAVRTARDDGADASDDAGPWHFVVNGVNYVTVIEHADDGGLRESFYRAFRARGTAEPFDNRPIVEEILRLRQEQAALVGFDCYAERSIDAKMAPSVEAVLGLLDELESAARPVARRELEALQEHVQKLPEAPAEFAPWDIAYYAEKLREAEYHFDSEGLREYFQLPRVMDGLFELIAMLYGVDIRRSASDSVPVWDDSVEFYEVLRDGDVIAGFYMDPYARPGEKRGGAWMNTVVDRTRVLARDDAGSSIPVALFVMNARPPGPGKPALLSLDEVRTLFHEFGHATQHMFTEVEEGGASGMNLVEWDAVELASQFNEYWMDHKPFLRRLTGHVDSGEPLDDETLESIIASRNFMVGNATLRQLNFARVDMALHQHFGIPGSEDGRTPFDMEREIAEATLLTPRLPQESQLPAFGHLFAGGYAAGYYSYKWAEVLAADAFAAFKEAGLDDSGALRQVAERFRDTVLALGGSMPAAEVYRQFRGRDATAAALLQEQGLQ